MKSKVLGLKRKHCHAYLYYNTEKGEDRLAKFGKNC